MLIWIALELGHVHLHTSIVQILAALQSGFDLHAGMFPATARTDSVTCRSKGGSVSRLKPGRLTNQALVNKSEVSMFYI